MLTKCILNFLELNWYQQFGDNKKILNICHHMLTSSTQLQNKSFHVVEKTRTAVKCTTMKIARARFAKILFFVVKYANLWRSCRRRRRGCLSSQMATPTTTRALQICIFNQKKTMISSRPASPAPAFFILTYLFDVSKETLTRNDQIWGRQACDAESLLFSLNF